MTPIEAARFFGALFAAMAIVVVVVAAVTYFYIKARCDWDDKMREAMTPKLGTEARIRDGK